MKKIKVLNAYAGIGGNRKLWKNVEVTAIENNPKIAMIYKKFYPDDKIIITDAHAFILKNYQNYDLIWSSIPCKTHSRISVILKNKRYPDLSLYQEIIFLKTYFKNPWIVENVIPYYDPLIPGKKVGRHLFWCNFFLSSQFDYSYHADIKTGSIPKLEKMHGIDLSYLKNRELKREVLRNCVNPELGLHVFNHAIKKIPLDPIGNLFS